MSQKDKTTPKDEKSTQKVAPKVDTKKDQPKTEPVKEPKVKKESKFDLSDGFGMEDVTGIAKGFLKFVIRVIAIILFPYTWAIRMLKRSSAFLKAPNAKERPLNNEERHFVEALSTFFILTGLLLGILGGIILALQASDRIEAFLSDVKIEAILDIIIAFFAAILEIILWIIGVDVRAKGTDGLYRGNLNNVITPNGDRFGLLDLFEELSKFIGQILSTDPLILFIALSIIGVLIVFVIILVIETTVVRKLFENIGKLLKTLFSFPQQIYITVSAQIDSLNKTLSNFTIGKERLDHYSVSFHKKVAIFTYGLGIYTLIMGFIVGLTQISSNANAQQILFFIIILLAFGLGVGIIEMFLVTRFIDMISKDRYELEKEQKAKTG